VKLSILQVLTTIQLIVVKSFYLQGLFINDMAISSSCNCRISQEEILSLRRERPE